jgi:membrane-associated phospholipid phosphatase
LALNGAMILSTIPFGEHYLVDVIGGVAVAFVAIVGAQRYYGK